MVAIVAGNRAHAAQTRATESPEPPQEIPCVKPAPLFSAADYDGPFNKVVSYFSRKLEIKTVHPPHPREHGKMCGLDPGEKFGLFVSNSFEPVTFVGAGFDSGLAQAENKRPLFWARDGRLCKKVWRCPE